MPELPDVEAFRRYLDEHAAGQRIERVEVADTDVLRNTSPQGLGRAVSGRRFAAPDRHGKWLLARLERGDAAPTVVMHFGHFGMTGYLTWAGRGDDAGRGDEAGRHEHDRLVFVCEDGELRFNLMRKFGGVWLARVGQEVTDVTGELGPDAADLSRDALAEVLDGRRGG